MTSVSDPDQALAILQQVSQDLVIAAFRKDSPADTDLLQQIRAGHPETPVLVVTMPRPIEVPVQALKLGAYCFLTRPVHRDVLRFTVKRALEHAELQEHADVLRSNLDRKYGFDNIAGRSGTLLYILDTAARATSWLTPATTHS